MSEASPAVERAVSAARQRGGDRPPPAAVALALLDDDEGRPAEAVAALGASLADVRRALDAVPPPADPPAVGALYAAARSWSLAHRADPAFTSDAFLLVVLRADPAVRAAVASAGLSDDAFERHLGGGPRPTPPDEPVTHAAAEPPPTADAARVVDANLNRARESLRVLDDYCRFVLDDRVLTGELKRIRHQLADLTATLPAGMLLAARDTIGDVGTSLTALGEYDRPTVAAVAAANGKRLQESLRSVEEFGKVLDPAFARGVEELRYAAYTLERAVVRGADARTRLADALLYVLVGGADAPGGLERIVRSAAAGGADVIQLREKGLADRELVARARDVRRWTAEVGVLFVVNDRPDVARLAGADGVHLGQDDCTVADARRLLGPAPLIGVSTHTLDDVRRAVLDGADYIGVGPTFPSRTKRFDHFPGVAFVRDVTAATSLPAFVLGGIGPDTIADAVAAGARRVAVGAAVTAAADPEAAARALKASLLSPPG